VSRSSGSEAALLAKRAPSSVPHANIAASNMNVRNNLDLLRFFGFFRFPTLFFMRENNYFSVLLCDFAAVMRASISFQRSNGSTRMNHTQYMKNLEWRI
jgi:hypothetical protein